jgi:hypothetical protein
MLSRFQVTLSISVTLWTFVIDAVIHPARGVWIKGGGRVMVLANAPPCGLTKWLNGPESQVCLLHEGSLS